MLATAIAIVFWASVTPTSSRLFPSRAEAGSREALGIGGGDRRPHEIAAKSSYQLIQRKASRSDSTEWYSNGLVRRWQRPRPSLGKSAVAGAYSTCRHPKRKGVSFTPRLAPFFLAHLGQKRRDALEVFMRSVFPDFLDHLLPMLFEILAESCDHGCQTASRSKTDAADAEAICEVVTRPTMPSDLTATKRLIKLGHEVRLMPPAYVKPYVKQTSMRFSCCTRPENFWSAKRRAAASGRVRLGSSTRSRWPCSTSEGLQRGSCKATAAGW